MINKNTVGSDILRPPLETLPPCTCPECSTTLSTTIPAQQSEQKAKSFKKNAHVSPSTQCVPILLHSRSLPSHRGPHETHASTGQLPKEAPMMTRYLKAACCCNFQERVREEGRESPNAPQENVHETLKHKYLLLLISFVLFWWRECKEAKTDVWKGESVSVFLTNFLTKHTRDLCLRQAKFIKQMLNKLVVWTDFCRHCQNKMDALSERRVSQQRPE